MNKLLSLIFVVFVFAGCSKEDDPTSLLGNKYVNESTKEFMPGWSQDNYDWGEYLKSFLPIFEGYYTITVKVEKHQRNSRKDKEDVQRTISLGKSDCSIRTVRTVKEQVRFANDEMATCKFEKVAITKNMLDPITQEYRDILFSIKNEGVYEDEKKMIPFNEDYQIKYYSKKADNVTYEDLTHITDETENFTYAQDGSIILMENSERKIEGALSSDYKTITLTQTYPEREKIGEFELK